MKLFGLVVLTARQYGEQQDADEAFVVRIQGERDNAQNVLNAVRAERNGLKDDVKRFERTYKDCIESSQKEISRLNAQITELTAKLAAQPVASAAQEPEPAPEQPVQQAPVIDPYAIELQPGDVVVPERFLDIPPGYAEMIGKKCEVMKTIDKDGEIATLTPGKSDYWYFTRPCLRFIRRPKQKGTDNG